MTDRLFAYAGAALETALLVDQMSTAVCTQADWTTIRCDGEHMRCAMIGSCT